MPIPVRSSFLPSSQFHAARQYMAELAERMAQRPVGDGGGRLLPRMREGLLQAMDSSLEIFAADQTLDTASACVLHFGANNLLQSSRRLPPSWALSSYVATYPLLAGYDADVVDLDEQNLAQLTFWEVVANFGVLGYPEYVAVGCARDAQAQNRPRLATACRLGARVWSCLLEPSRAAVQACRLGGCILIAGVAAALWIPLHLLGAVCQRRTTPGERLAPDSHWSSYALDQEVLAPRLVEVVEKWSADVVDPGAGIDVDVLAWDLSTASQRHLGDFLARLRSTPEYKSASTRPGLIDRVATLLRTMDAEPELRALCIDKIDFSVDTCEDRVALALGDLEVACHVYRATKSANPSEALEQLGVSLLQLEVINKHAAAFCARWGRLCDPVQVYLNFQTHATQRLKLPVSCTKAVYPGGVRTVCLNAAVQEASTAARDPVRVQTFLASWEPWQSWIRTQQVARFAPDTLARRPIAGPQAADLLCPFTQLPLDALAQPVVWGEDDKLRVAEQQPLLRWYGINGTCPTTRAPLRLEQMRRPVVVANSAGANAPRAA